MSILIQDRDFQAVANAAGVGIARGEAMAAWWNSFPKLHLHDLPGSNPNERMQSFFGTMPIEGKTTDFMGCIQSARFSRRAAAGQPTVSLAKWVKDNFLQKCRWTNPDGTRGGFLYRPVLVKDRDDSGMPRRVDENFDLKIGEIGSRYAWAAVRLDVLDYIKAFPYVGAFSKYLEWLNREAGYMVLHPNFFHSPYPKPERCVEDCCFAYSVSPWTVEPTITAYGPGRFHSAFKQFRFFLLEDGTVVVEVLFLVAPRCEQVLSIFGIDPFFDTTRMMDLFTLGLAGFTKEAKESVSAYAIGHHARVHNNLLQGMRSIWERTNWQPASASSESRSLASSER